MGSTIRIYKFDFFLFLNFSNEMFRVHFETKQTMRASSYITLVYYFSKSNQFYNKRHLINIIISQYLINPITTVIILSG